MDIKLGFVRPVLLNLAGAGGPIDKFFLFTIRKLLCGFSSHDGGLWQEPMNESLETHAGRFQGKVQIVAKMNEQMCR